MTHVVTDKCKYTDCVEVCPIDCFHEGANFPAIDPEECIDCTLCVPEGKEFAEHKVSGDITIQYLEGVVELTLHDRRRCCGRASWSILQATFRTRSRESKTPP